MGRWSSLEGFGAACESAIGIKGPAMVEIDMGTIGDHPPYYPFRSKVPVVDAAE